MQINCPACGALVITDAEPGRSFVCGRCNATLTLAVVSRPQVGPSETKDWRPVRVGPHSRYVGRVNAGRGLLEVRYRGEDYLVDIGEDN